MNEQKERYSRQLLFKPIGEEGQLKLQSSRVLIVGMGALGTAIANHLVRAGIGHVRFVDRDYVERSNLQRQMLYDESDAIESLPKAVAAERKLRKINSDVTVEGVTSDVTIENVDEFLDGIDIAIDGTDNFDTRFLLNDACFKKEIPFVYGGAVSSRGMSAIFIPNKTPCLRCLLSKPEQGGETCDTIGVISPIVDITASYEAVEVLKYLTGNRNRTSLLTYDIWNNHFYEMNFKKPKADCPTCQLKEYPSLRDNREDNVTVLCGRSTVQIQSRSSFNLNEWEERLHEVGQIHKTPFLLRVDLEEGERLVLFPDGRTLVQGTEDVVRAKTLFARYIGS